MLFLEVVGRYVLMLRDYSVISSVLRVSDLRSLGVTIHL